ncbi:S49 family peptidase [Campylobacter sp. 19-13652]|uniref:phage major capsid protein n=1 Tax=Campylobacter sp. 19-13652 TaxID=2840180 RepID=UPI001C775974|nr:S49 family peptidase [Campylobacter sp. 19-13652]BCX79280.1 hypothetical protein LBC_07420 [Campylobacter sp. 19-13652]
MNNELGDELLAPLAISKESLLSFLSINFNSNLSARPQSRYQSTKEQIILPVSGMMFRYENAFTKLGYGISTQTLKENIKQAIDSGAEVLLVIDSGGGVVNGITDLCDYVAQNKDKVSAFVKGYAASAAFWLASSCGKIYAERSSRLGSIGVASAIFDAKGFFKNLGINAKEIANTLSPNKRPDLATDEGEAILRVELDAAADIFISAVSKNLKISKEDVVSKFNQGGTITGEQAYKYGFINALGSLDDFIKGVNMDKQAMQTAEAVLPLKAEKSVADITQNSQKASIELDKFKALSEYRTLLSDDEHEAFAKDETVSAQAIKDFILQKQAKAKAPVAFSQVIVGDDLGKEAKKQDVIDAVALMVGNDAPNASNQAYRLANSGSLKAMLAHNSGLGYLNSDSDFMSAMTTSDFPVLLKSSLSRVLEDGFSKAETTYRSLVKEVAHPDFREYTSVQMQDVPANVWDNPLVEGGETRSFSLSESTRGSRVESYGAKFNITRQMLVNDDLGAFVGMVQKFAKSADKFINKCVYDFIQQRGKYANFTLKDGHALFDKTNHKNVIDGAKSALSKEALSSARIAMSRQKDEWGEDISIHPKLLIVPPELVDVATELMVSSATLEANKNSGVKNIYQGAYSIITDPALSEPEAWYLFAKEQICLGYLRQNGGAKPIIELKDKSLVDGLVYEGVLDFVVYAANYQGVLKSKGKA